MGQLFIDQYSLCHAAVGVVVYFFGIDIDKWFVLHLAFEMLENTKMGMSLIRMIKVWPGGKPYADSIINIVGDQLSAMFGYLMASAVDRYGSKAGWYPKHN